MGGVVDAIGDVVGGAADVVGDVVGGVADIAGDVIETVADNPELAIIAGIFAAPYLAPELLDDSNPIISPAADCWALGVFLYELICGDLPFFDENLGVIESKIAKAEWDPSCLPPNLQPICIGLFQIDPKKRWNTDKILEYLSTIGFK